MTSAATPARGSGTSSRITARFTTAVTAAALTLATTAGLALAATGNAEAAATTITASPAQGVYATGATATINVTTDQSATSLRIDVTSGPDSGITGQACTTRTATSYTCSVTNRGGAAGSGVDQLRVYDDKDASGSFTAGDTFTTTTVKFGDAIANLAVTPAASAVSAQNGDAVTVAATDANNIASVGRSAYLTVKETLSKSLGAAAPDNPLTLTVTGGTAATYNDGNCGSVNTSCTFTATATGTVNSAGNVYATVSSSKAGIVTVTAADAATSPTVSKSANITVTGGNSGDAAVHTLTVTPTTGTYATGDSVRYVATASDTNGDPVGSATVRYVVTSGPDADPSVYATCGTTTQSSGQAACTIGNASAAGTDKITFYINTSSGSAAPQSGEPQAAAQATFVQQPGYDQITVTCVDPSLTHGAANQNRTDCVLPAGGTPQPVTLTVTVSKKNAQGVETGVPNATVNLTSTGLPTTSASGSATTNSQGVATLSVTPTASTADGNSVTITAIVGNGNSYTGTASSAAKATVHYQARVEYAALVTPTSQSAQINGIAAVTAEVIDQFGTGVASAQVVVTVTGRNSITSPTLTTGSDGTAPYQYSDTGSAQTTGSDTVRATAPGATNPSSAPAAVAWVHSTAPATVSINLVAGSTPACVAAGRTTTGSTVASSATAYSLCALVQNSDGEALTGADVTTSVDLGGVRTSATSAAAANQLVATDGSGTADFFLGSSASGTQHVTVTVGALSASATITYAPGAATSVTLTPSSTTVAAGGKRRFSATATDAYGNVVYDPSNLATDEFVFQASGPGTFDGARTTTAYAGSNGVATVTLSVPATGTGSGSVTVTPYAHAGTTAPSAASTYSVGTPEVAGVSVQASSPVVVRNIETVTATVQDIDGQPIANSPVAFDVTGAQSTTGTAMTDSSGVATFSFRTLAAGSVTVKATDGSSSGSVAVTVAKQQVAITFGTYSPVTGEVTLVALVSPASGVVVGQRVGFYQRAGSGYVGPITAVVDNRGRAQITVNRTSGVTYVFHAAMADSANVTGATTGDKAVKVK